MPTETVTFRVRAIDGGELTTEQLYNYGTVNLASGSLTLDDIPWYGWSDCENDGTINWSGGTLDIASNSLKNYGTINIDGGSNSFAGTGGGSLFNNYGTIDWTGGNVSVGFTIVNGAQLTLEGQNHVFTLAGDLNDSGWGPK